MYIVHLDYSHPTVSLFALLSHSPLLLTNPLLIFMVLVLFCFALLCVVIY